MTDCKSLTREGADIIELGVPFSDPLADGPTIQRASERALAQNVTLKKVIQSVSSMRIKVNTAIALMTYFNPVFKYGTEKFINDAANAGVDGIIIPDLPFDEEPEFIEAAKTKNLNTIFLTAPTSTDERIKEISKAASGFIYYVSITGITGAKLIVEQRLKDMVSKIKTLSSKPVAVGFGVKTPDDAKAVSLIADGVIIGSSIVQTINEDLGSLEKYIRALRQSI
ncbi:tryptophan synthase, alpha subunit [Candidatus Magnetoovum chiemensis]|nr:tryptophan synthase, alpha subunit [Candidatus Magnetoovum chiemensis]